MTVLSARATELERDFPFGAVRQWLEPPLRTASAGSRAELLEGAAAYAAPALGFADGHAAASGAGAGFTTLNGLYWLVSGLAEERPLLLELDDAHWGDRDSVRFLAFLVPRLSELPVLLLAAARPEEWNAESLFAATASDPASRPLTPRELSAGATTALVEAAFGRPGTRAGFPLAAAADGRTNREIAQDLFLSVKTVEWHLGQIFRKLEISSRKELTRALAE